LIHRATIRQHIVENKSWEPTTLASSVIIRIKSIASLYLHLLPSGSLKHTDHHIDSKDCNVILIANSILDLDLSAGPTTHQQDYLSITLTRKFAYRLRMKLIKIATQLH